MAEKNLGNIENPKPPKQIIIGENHKKEGPSKEQKTFNRLVCKLEKLRGEINKTQTDLNIMLDFYSKEIYPVKRNLSGIQTSILKLLFANGLSDNKLTKQPREGLRYVMEHLLRDVFEVTDGPEDEEMERIFEAVVGTSFREINADLSSEEMMRRMMEKQAMIDEQWDAQEEKSIHRRKTKKQLEKEERVCKLKEMKDTHLSLIYRQLDKVLHPDLEQDPEHRKEKEALMQKLSAAYKQKDLITMLKFEMEWIHKEENEWDKLPNDQLDLYNKLLKEQIHGLGNELETLRHHPRYEPLFSLCADDFGFSTHPSMHLLREYRDNLLLMKDNAENILADASGDHSLQVFRDLGNQMYAQKQQEEKEEREVQKVMKKFNRYFSC